MAVVAVALAGLAASPGAATAQSAQDLQQQSIQDKGPPGSVRGCVTASQDGGALAGVNVLLVEENLGTTTDASGCYELYGAALGPATVRASHIGYATQEQQSEVPPGGTAQADFVLSSATLGQQDLPTFPDSGGSFLWRLVFTAIPLLGIFLGLELVATRMDAGSHPVRLAPLLGGMTGGLVVATALGFVLAWSRGEDPMAQFEWAPYWWLSAAAALWLALRRGPRPDRPSGTLMGLGLLGGLLGAAVWLALNAAGYLLLTALQISTTLQPLGWSWYLAVSSDVWSDLLVGAGVGYLVAIWLSPPQVQSPADGAKEAETDGAKEAETDGASEPEQTIREPNEAPPVQSEKAREPVFPEPRVFLSHRRSDAGKDAYRLYDRLRQALGSERVFMDMEDVAPGQSFDSALAAALKRSTHMLVIMGPDWARPLGEAAESTYGQTEKGYGQSEITNVQAPSDFVQREIELAFSMDLRVIPVLVSGARMPPPEDMPPSIRRLSRLQAIELRSRRSFTEDADRLVAVLRESMQTREAEGLERS